MLDEGRLADARERFWSDAAAAQADGDAEALARAALGLGGVWVHEHRSTLERARVLELQQRALDALDPAAPLARRLRTRLAAEDAYLTGRRAAVWAALDAARSSGDRLALTEALSLAHHCLLGPDHGAARLALADELIAVAVGTGRAVDGLVGLAWRTIDLFLVGDRRAERSLRELHERLAVRRCDCIGYVAAALDVMLAIRAGRLDEAERLADAGYSRGIDAGDADALGWYGAQLVAIRWYQGRGEELLPLLHDMARSPTLAEPNLAFLAAIAALAAGAGLRDEAQAALAGLRASSIEWLRQSSSYVATLLGVCEAAHALGDAEAAREGYQRLAPFADLPVMASLAVACFGSAHRPLGLAAMTTGDIDRAIDHFERAVAADRAIGNAPAHALSLAALAEALERRHHANDLGRAAGLRATAIRCAHRCGMTVRARAWESHAADASATERVECRRDGALWRVRVGDTAVVVPDSVGMRYLATLVERSGEYVPAIELASGHALTCRGAPDESMLDSHAKAAYRQRVQELRAEVDDAEQCCDLERAARARLDLDLLLEELARATGLAGKSRSFTDDAERARVAVQKALKRALARVAQSDAVVGQVLGARVVTGIRCAFIG